MERVEQLLRDLVALPSVNPAFLANQPEFTGEARVGEFIAQTCSRAGLEVKWGKGTENGRRNILASLKPGGKVKHRLLLAPHLDTVGGEAPGNLFKPRISQGRLYGRGACDTKGSLAVMLACLLELARNGPRPARTEIILAGLIDEENAQKGSRALAASGLKADLAIVGEPTRCNLITAHKGDLWLKLFTRGKAAHGARPELGDNAVHRMARIVDFIETTCAASLRKNTHPLLGQGTINVGAIRGGVQANIVPDYCEILVDRRTLPGENDARISRELLRELRHAGLRAELENYKLSPCPPLETSPNLPWVRQFLSLLHQSQPMGVDYFCDAAILAQGGIPSVVFGPGDIAQAHTEDEWISLRELAKAERLLGAFLRSLP